MGHRPFWFIILPVVPRLSQNDSTREILLKMFDIVVFTCKHYQIPKYLPRVGTTKADFDTLSYYILRLYLTNKTIDRCKQYAPHTY